MEKEHLAGHSGTTRTVNTIVKSKGYIWPGMEKDVENYIKNCRTCIRFNYYPRIHHPALSKPIKEVSHIVGVDLVKCPTTPEG